MTQDEMNILVPERLQEIERTQNIKVLYAAESGSRAWGFASPDSDFDVRFIYKRPPEDYLRLDEIRDVIEIPINEIWDIRGWDLNKTLRLLYKSNPTLYEWLASPICYCDKDFTEKIKPVTREYFSRERMIYHYMSMVRTNMDNFRDTIRPKQYFYVLRPILACLYVMKKDSPLPVLFETLCKFILPENLRDCVNSLLEMKINSPEKSEIQRVSELEKFLNETFNYVSNYLENLPKNEPHSWDLLNKFFLGELEL